LPLFKDEKNNGEDQGWTDFQGRKNTPTSKVEALMDIQTISSAYGVKAYEPSAKSEKKSADSGNKTTSSQEIVAFSDTSLTMQKLKEAVKAAPEIRIPIVEKIQEKIKEDNYPIDRNAESALDRMIKARLF
jgi:anti-sigma28 factor (negative regulator of flagellin synthesis)